MSEPSGHPPAGELVVLDLEECLHLLATTSIGRLAIGRPDQGPLVVPVNYSLDGDVVVFRTDPGTKLDLLLDQPVSFEVDAIDPYRRTGWSVLVSGAARELDDPGGGSGVEPWVAGPKTHWIRIEGATVSGRRIQLPDLPVDRRGYL